ncbi:styrene monooxygenase NADH-dependent flavin reductase subunit StyB [Pseudonocardia abyssalis]|uniref:Flavin reductase family protein n=1 Tax=Pseudonocardia abyssalis TaxID=2792008 RepID=A0ABS6URG5_9PSEU|nr:flavin reductase family protein [Pseudonocardia abyssalis]MBW0113752.1 flavin reductase family protein [Pseudonocardia abyssalis]MBW0134825.1 flavin reductase family protein [Pseudonocardia abyssalis]
MLTLDSQQFRQQVGQFATGVAVISCTDPEMSCTEFDYAVHGATVNSFTSVSVKPPTVMVSLMAGRAHQFITGNGHFGASVLTEEQQHCSDYFAGKRYADTPEFTIRDRVPTLVDCLAWFECEVIQRFEVHDHTVFVARVLACGSNGGSPLLFFGSQYHRPALGRSRTS